MDLFTYLMAKNGNNTSVHGDLFSYLLGKGQSQTYTVSGTTIYIPNAKKLVSLIMTKESSQETTTGKQLFDKDNANIINAYIADGADSLQSSTTARSLYIKCDADTTYTISKISSKRFRIASSIDIPVSGVGIVRYFYSNDTATEATITTNSTAEYIIVYYYSSTSDTLTEQEILDSIMIEKGSTATEYEPYTGGQPSPNPDYPQEVKTVKGYSNLLNVDENLVFTRSKSINVNIPAGTYYLTKKDISNTSDGSKNVTIRFFDNNIIYNISNPTNLKITLTKPETVIYLFSKVDYPTSAGISATVNQLMLVEGDQELPYVPYGNNYIAVNVSDGNTTNSYPIPLNGNEIAGIGNYLDELIVDESGHCWLNKKTGKVILDSTKISSYSDTYKRISFNYSDNPNFIENSNGFYTIGIVRTTGSLNTIFHNRIIIRRAGSSTMNISAWVDGVESLEDAKEYFTNNEIPLYYELATPDLIDLNAKVDLKLFKGVNNVSNSEDANMTIEYR